MKYIDPTGHGVDCGIGMGCVGDYVPPSSGNGGGGGGGSYDYEPNNNNQSENTNDEPEPEYNDVFQPFGLDSDYYSLSVYHGFPGWLLSAGIGIAGLAEPTPAGEIGAITLALLVNGGLNLTIDRYGRLYVSPGVSVGLNSFEPLPTVSVWAGNLVHGRDQGLPILEQSSPDEISALLTEFSTTHGACNAFFPCGGTTQSPAAPYDSLEFGAGFPGHLNLVTGSFGLGPFPLLGNP